MIFSKITLDKCLLYKRFPKHRLDSNSFYISPLTYVNVYLEVDKYNELKKVLCQHSRKKGILPTKGSCWSEGNDFTEFGELLLLSKIIDQKTFIVRTSAIFKFWTSKLKKLQLLFLAMFTKEKWRLTGLHLSITAGIDLKQASLVSSQPLSLSLLSLHLTLICQLKVELSFGVKCYSH